MVWTTFRQTPVVDGLLTPAALPDAGRFGFCCGAEGRVRKKFTSPPIIHVLLYY
jgi:hypothetical protein